MVGRKWYEKLKNVFAEAGLISSNFDPCVFYSGTGEDVILAAVCIEDILVVSRNLNKMSKLEKHLKSSFELKDLGILNYCLGIEFIRNGNKHE